MRLDFHQNDIINCFAKFPSRTCGMCTRKPDNKLISFFFIYYKKELELNEGEDDE